MARIDDTLANIVQTWTSDLRVKKTGNLKLVMQTMGHVDVKTAMKYQHPELDIVRSALNETEPDVPQAGA